MIKRWARDAVAGDCGIAASGRRFLGGLKVDTRPVFLRMVEMPGIAREKNRCAVMIVGDRRVIVVEDSF